jgi:hypothetical protein
MDSRKTTAFELSTIGVILETPTGMGGGTSSAFTARNRVGLHWCGRSTLTISRLLISSCRQVRSAWLYDRRNDDISVGEVERIGI